MERESIKSIRNMRVMCIERSSHRDSVGSEFTIEPGQWLEVYDVSKDYTYYTFEVNNQSWGAERNKFITLQQWRENQLNQLGI